MRTPPVASSASPAPVLIAFFDASRLDDYLQLAAMIREHPRFKAMMENADARLAAEGDSRRA